MKIHKKFRGKIKDKNEWIYGGLAYINDSPFVIYEMAKGLPKIEEVEENSVGQYSCVCDKNNLEMCEGDIIYGAAHWLERYKPAVVTFRNGSFGLLWHRGDIEVFNPFTSMCNIEYEVIGNIHDNPELLKGGAE
jgi:uncharacterized phage protein (TIGR01671 family)